MSTDLQSKRIYRYHSNKHFSGFLPTRWRRKSNGIDKEQNYVTVTVCIGNMHKNWTRSAEDIIIIIIVNFNFRQQDP